MMKIDWNRMKSVFDKAEEIERQKKKAEVEKKAEQARQQQLCMAEGLRFFELRVLPKIYDRLDAALAANKRIFSILTTEDAEGFAIQWEGMRAFEKGKCPKNLIQDAVAAWAVENSIKIESDSSHYEVRVAMSKLVELIDMIQHEKGE